MCAVVQMVQLLLFAKTFRKGFRLSYYESGIVLLEFDYLILKYVRMLLVLSHRLLPMMIPVFSFLR